MHGSLDILQLRLHGGKARLMLHSFLVDRFPSFPYFCATATTVFRSVFSSTERTPARSTRRDALSASAVLTPMAPRTLIGFESPMPVTACECANDGFALRSNSTTRTTLKLWFAVTCVARLGCGCRDWLMLDVPSILA